MIFIPFYKLHRILFCLKIKCNSGISNLTGLCYHILPNKGFSSIQGNLKHSFSQDSAFYNLYYHIIIPCSMAAYFHTSDTNTFMIYFIIQHAGTIHSYSIHSRIIINFIENHSIGHLIFSKIRFLSIRHFCLHTLCILFLKFFHNKGETFILIF